MIPKRFHVWAAAAAMAGAAGCREVPRPAQQSAPAPSSAKSSAADETTSAPRPPAAPPEPASCAGERVELVEQAMGTRIAIVAYTTGTLNRAAVRQALRASFDEIVRLEALMTPWREDSELSRINAAAGGKEPVPVGPEIYEVIDKSLWISRRSEGAFDVTFASMGKLWRFDHDLVAEVPPADAIARARKRIDYRQIQLFSEQRAVLLRRADQKIDLGGIAKGYAVDRAADILRQRGLEAFYVQAGGDLYVEGKKPDGEPMRVGVRDPRGPDGSFFARLPVENHAFSTAGDYERQFILDGKRYHHIIDPRTGYPATASRSVTVWAKDALTADAIDDAVFILGPEKGLELVESIDDCGAVIVDADNKVWISRRLQGLVEIFGRPSDGI